MYKKTVIFLSLFIIAICAKASIGEKLILRHRFKYRQKNVYKIKWKVVSPNRTISISMKMRRLCIKLTNRKTAKLSFEISENKINGEQSPNPPMPYILIAKNNGTIKKVVLGNKNLSPLFHFPNSEVDIGSRWNSVVNAWIQVRPFIMPVKAKLTRVLLYNSRKAVEIKFRGTRVYNVGMKIKVKLKGKIYFDYRAGKTLYKETESQYYLFQRGNWYNTSNAIMYSKLIN